MQEQIFYQGVVENNVDPLKLYRVQIRVFGIHTENKSDSESNSYMPVSDLPWADVLLSGSGMDGEGQFIQMVKGTTVIVSFLDPEKQRPVVIGSLPRIVAALPDFESGFSDPDEIHPKQENLEESTISRLARSEKIDLTIIQDKIDNIKTDVDCNGVSWDEPQTQYNAVYPNNRVIHTKSHVFEMDDTDGVERVHIYHKTGSSKEYHPNGDEVNITKNKKFTIVISDDDILIEGSNNIRIGGSQNIFIVGNENKRVGGDQNIDVDGNRNINVVENVNKTVGGDQIVDVVGNDDKTIGGNQTIIIDGNQTIESIGPMILKSPTITLDGVVNVTNNLSVTGGASGTFSGDMIMTGTLSGAGAINLDGNIDSAGNIIAAGLNSNHHSHP